MEAGLTDHDWTVEDLILEDLQAAPASSGFGIRSPHGGGQRSPRIPKLSSRSLRSPSRRGHPRLRAHATGGCGEWQRRSGVALAFSSICGKTNVDLRKGLDKAGLFESYLKSKIDLSVFQPFTSIPHNSVPLLIRLPF